MKTSQYSLRERPRSFGRDRSVTIYCVNVNQCRVRRAHHISNKAHLCRINRWTSRPMVQCALSETLGAESSSILVALSGKYCGGKNYRLYSDLLCCQLPPHDFRWPVCRAEFQVWSPLLVDGSRTASLPNCTFARGKA